jgi:hypothetical protein
LLVRFKRITSTDQFNLQVQPRPKRCTIACHRRAREELLRGGFARGLPLNYVTLVCGLARHVFELKLSQLLQLPDLFSRQLSRQIDCVVSVEEIGSGERPQN